MTASFHGLIEAHYSRALRAALAILGDREEAREVTQEAVARAWAARARYDPGRPFYPWMYRILKNTALDARARQRTRKPLPLDEGRVRAGGASPDRATVERAEHRRLWRAMQTLRDDQQEILNLRHFQDLSYAEIAQALEVPEGTVMSRLYRARKALARAMEEGQ